MEKAYQDFKIRQFKRERVLGYGLALFFVYLFVWAALVLLNLWFSGYWLLAGPIAFVLGFFYVVSRPWLTESAKTRVFANLYEATRYLQEGRGKNEESKLLYVKEAGNDVRTAIIYLTRLSTKPNANASEKLQKEDVDPFYRLAHDFYTRVYPRVILERDFEEMIQVLLDSARVFSTGEGVNTGEVAAMDDRLEQYKPIEYDDIVANKLFQAIPGMFWWRGWGVLPGEKTAPTD